MKYIIYLRKTDNINIFNIKYFIQVSILQN